MFLVEKHRLVAWKMQGLVSHTGIRSSRKSSTHLINQKTFPDHTTMICCTTIATLSTTESSVWHLSEALRLVVNTWHPHPYCQKVLLSDRRVVLGYTDSETEAGSYLGACWA